MDRFLVSAAAAKASPSQQTYRSSFAPFKSSSADGSDYGRHQSRSDSDVLNKPNRFSPPPMGEHRSNGHIVLSPISPSSRNRQPNAMACADKANNWVLQQQPNQQRRPPQLSSLAWSSTRCGDDDENVAPSPNKADLIRGNFLANVQAKIMSHQHSLAAAASPKSRDSPMGTRKGSTVVSASVKFPPAVGRLVNNTASPSASSALRAKEALRADRPQYFDVPHDQQDLVTDDDRILASSAPATIQDVMRNVVVYVEIRTGADNRSEGIKTVIAQLGAAVNDRLLRNTTHVVFKDGLISTYQKARNWNIPVVSILWVEACRKYVCLMDPREFVISNVERYEQPELFQKMRKQKSMQPNAEETRRRKNLTPKTATPKSHASVIPSATSVSSAPKITYPYKPKDNLPDIYAKFTQQLVDAEQNDDDDEVDSNLRLGESSKILEIIRNSPVVTENQQRTQSAVAKASKSKSRRTLFSYFTPASQEASDSQSSAASDTTIAETQEPAVEIAHKSNVYSQEVSFNSTATPVRLTRRNSMTSKATHIADAPQAIVRNHEKSVVQIETPVRLTRRNSMTAPSTPKATPAKTPRKTIRKTIFPSVEEEPSNDDSMNMNLTNIQSVTKPVAIVERTTCYASKSMEETHTPSALDRLDALMTTPLAQQRPTTTTLLSSVLRRKTMYTPQSMQETFVEQATQPEYASPATLAALDKANAVEEADVAKPSSSRRRTLFTPNRVVAFKRDRVHESDQLLNQTPEPANDPQTPSTTLLRTLSLQTPVQTMAQVTKPTSHRNRPITPDTPPFHDAPNLDEPATILEAYNRTLATPHFSSTRMPSTATASNKRRTLFEMSKEIIDHRVRTINLASARKNRSMSESDLAAELDEPQASLRTVDTVCSASSPQLNKTGGLSKQLTENLSIDHRPTVQRKRKLFAPSVSLNLDDEPPAPILTSASKRTKSVAANKTAIVRPPAAASSTAAARRRTTMDFATTTNNNKTKMPATGVGVNPLLGDKFLVSTNMHREQIAVVQEAVEALGSFQLEQNVTAQTTHLVTLEPLRTVNLLRALIRGVWILRYEWVLESLRLGRWLAEESFEVRDFSAAVSICRTERQAFGPRYKIDIFADAPPIFIVASRCRCPALRELVTLCGGLVTGRRVDAKYVISDAYEAPVAGTPVDTVCVSSAWILDSISIAKRKKVTKYLLTTDDDE